MSYVGLVDHERMPRIDNISECLFGNMYLARSLNKGDRAFEVSGR
jgi:hypothetical protein